MQTAQFTWGQLWISDRQFSTAVQFTLKGFFLILMYSQRSWKNAWSRTARSIRFHCAPLFCGFLLSNAACALQVHLHYVDNSFTLWNEAVNDSVQFQYISSGYIVSLHLFVPSLALLFCLFLNPNGNRSSFYDMNVNGTPISLQSAGAEPNTWGHLRWSISIIWELGAVCVCSRARTQQNVPDTLIRSCLTYTSKVWRTTDSFIEI